MKLFQIFEARVSKDLVSELFWYQKYITTHDLPTEMEIEDDRLVFMAGDKRFAWNVEEAQQFRMETLADATLFKLYDFIEKHKGRFELAEPSFAKNAFYSLYYARIIKERFIRGEPAIAQDGEYSYLYAKDVIKGRFELGEPAIALDEDSLFNYQQDVYDGLLKRR